MLCKTIVALLMLCIVCQEAEEDLIDISQIDMFPQDYSHRLYSGYLQLAFFGKKFHYMYAESQHDPVNDPFLLWLNGGPGCSSMIGFLYENGPFIFEQNTTKLKINPYSWNLKANVMYLESPAGVGFSTGSGEELVYNDTTTAEDNLRALLLFFTKFPGLKKNNFYITGESYAGIYIPTLANLVLRHNSDSDLDRINLKGILVGNGCTHPTECAINKYHSYHHYQYLFQRGFLDEDQWDTFRASCAMGWNTTECETQQKKLYDFFRSTGADIYNIYGKCFNQTYPPTMQEFEYNLQFRAGLKNTLRCTDSIGSLVLFNTDKYRDPLHIYVDSNTLEWTTCSEKLNYTINPEGSYYLYPRLIKSGLKIMVYSGDADAIVPITGTVFWVRQLFEEMKLPFRKPWRPWVSDTQNISGMIWELEGLSLVTVLAAGHMVPNTNPVQAYTMLDNYLNDLEFKIPNDYVLLR